MTDMALWCIGSAICVAASGEGVLGILGSLCALTGACISVLGNLINTGTFTLWNGHLVAIKLWTVSSFLMAVWAFGHEMRWWDGGLGVLAVLGMNVVFLVSNLYGLQKQAQQK
jgi:hypothetical protein